MTNYIMNTILKNQNFDKKAVISQSIRYNNYVYFPDEIDFDFNYFFDLCKYDYYSVVEMFLKENINLNQTKKCRKRREGGYTTIDKTNTVFFAAVEKGNIEIVKLLLSHKGIDVNTKSRSGGI